jgi:replicative DNA helicase
MEPSLPADLVAERAVLGAILLEPEAILAVRWLQPSDFSLERYSWIYEAASECAADRVPPDIITISDRLRRHDRLDAVGGIAGLGELLESVPTAVYVEHYARIVHAASVRRALNERRAVSMRLPRRTRKVASPAFRCSCRWMHRSCESALTPRAVHKSTTTT